MHEVRQRKWWYRKRSWFFIVTCVLLGLFIWSLPAKISGLVMDTARAYGDPKICEDALKIANENTKVLEAFGKLESVGKMALFEGYVNYSKNKDSVAITFGVIGSRSEDQLKSNMDIYAIKNKSDWEYQKIQIRIKKPIEKKETIVILEK